MTRPLQNLNTLQDLYADALSSIWEFFDRIFDPSYALRNEVDIWEIALRDATIYQGVQTRLNNVAGPNWRIFPQNGKDPREKTFAAIIEDAFKNIKHFRDARKRMAHSIYRGASWEFIKGARKNVSLGGLPEMDWWMPVDLENVDPRRFTIRPQRVRLPDGSVRVNGQWFISVVAGQGSTSQSSSAPSLTKFIPLENPEFFVHIIYENEESRLGFGRGALDAIYFLNWVKTILMREGLQGIERWSQGIVIGS
jgi:hypothetical protein